MLSNSSGSPLTMLLKLPYIIMDKLGITSTVNNDESHEKKRLSVFQNITASGESPTNSHNTSMEIDQT